VNVGGAGAWPEPVDRVPRPSSSYQENLAWLYSLQRFGIKLGLENIQRLIAALHVNLSGARVIHVAGTNGKGSVCAMIDSIARAANYRTGLFTSPHLITFRERIRVNGEMISEDAVAVGLTNIRDLVHDWEPHPTFFEITTALALKYFSQTKIDPLRAEGSRLDQSAGSPSSFNSAPRDDQRVVPKELPGFAGSGDIAILETGLGGRLDATNAIQSDVSVITPIALDHQKWLGDSLEKIASEKAGIIKLNVPIVSAPQEREAEAVLRKRAVDCEAPLQFVNESYAASPVALVGRHQKQNAALAIAALAAAEIDIDDSTIQRGLAKVEWPARFQRWDDRTVIDGAHNPAAVRILAGTWRETFGEEHATLILAILSDKDVNGICEALAPISAFVVLPKIRSERAADPEDLARILTAISPSLPYSITPSIAHAIEQARAKPNPILLTGSLHFAGEALAHLRGEPAAFEECAQ
jgi:dihydrofolate synthase/folylpolyglutamate synthase